MTTLLDCSLPPFPRFAPRPCAGRKRRVGILGAGDVTLNKIWKAVERFYPRLDGIAVCSREPQSPLEGMPHRYYALLEPVVDMRHDLMDALDVVALVQACRDAAVEAPDYPFGWLPSFLQGKE